MDNNDCFFCGKGVLLENKSRFLQKNSVVLKAFPFLLITITSITTLKANNADESYLPRVFQIGEYQEEYEQLIEDYELTLTDVCNDDLYSAFGKLSSMFKEMEVFAENNAYDLKGVRMWLHLFWDKSGTIQHLAFHLRPNSRNVDVADLEAFLLSFVKYYRFPLISENDYSLYTSTAFPVYARRRKGN